MARPRARVASRDLKFMAESSLLLAGAGALGGQQFPRPAPIAATRGSASGCAQGVCRRVGNFRHTAERRQRARIALLWRLWPRDQDGTMDTRDISALRRPTLGRADRPATGRLHPHSQQIADVRRPVGRAHGYMDQAVALMETQARAQPVPGMTVEVVRLEGRTP